MIIFCFQIFFKDRTTSEAAFVLFVRRNALQVLIPKYGLEGTVLINKENQKNLVFNEEVSYAILIDMLGLPSLVGLHGSHVGWMEEYKRPLNLRPGTL